MQFTRLSTVKYITDMTAELQKMAEQYDTPALSYLLKMAQMEGKNVLQSEKVSNIQSEK